MDAVLVGEAEILDLELADEQVVHLLRHARLEAGLDHLQELPGSEVRGAERTHFSARDQLLHRPQRGLQRSGVIGLVEVVQLDAVGPQPAQAFLDRRGDPLRRKTLRFGHAGADADFGGDARLRAAASQRAAQDPLGFTPDVRVRSIEENQPTFQGPVNDAMRLRLRGALAEVHGADGQSGRDGVVPGIEVAVHPGEDASRWAKARTGGCLQVRPCGCFTTAVLATSRRCAQK